MITNENSHDNLSEKDPEEQDSLWRLIVNGRLISGTMFKRYWVQIMLTMAMLLIYITNVFACRQKMENIARLQDRLAVVQTECLRARGIYMSRIRESEMKQRLDSLNLPLSIQQQPPFHAKISRN